MAEARRERIAVAMKAALVAGCAPIEVERNRRAPVSDQEAPRLVVFDLGHEASYVDVGDVTYTMQIEIEGTVTGEEDELGTAVNALYVQILQSLADPTLGGLCIGLNERSFDPRIVSEAESATPLVTFSLAFDVQFMTPDGDPTG